MSVGDGIINKTLMIICTLHQKNIIKIQLGMILIQF